MIDINNIISQVITTAVQQAIAPLNERIAALELRLSEEALATLIEQEFIDSIAFTDVVGHDEVNSLRDRITELENKTL